MAQTTCFRIRKCLLGLGQLVTSFGGNMCQKPPKWARIGNFNPKRQNIKITISLKLSGADRGNKSYREYVVSGALSLPCHQLSSHPLFFLPLLSLHVPFLPFPSPFFLSFPVSSSFLPSSSYSPTAKRPPNQARGPGRTP